MWAWGFRGGRGVYWYVSLWMCRYVGIGLQVSVYVLVCIYLDVRDHRLGRSNLGLFLLNDC